MFKVYKETESRNLTVAKTNKGELMLLTKCAVCKGLHLEWGTGKFSGVSDKFY